MRRDWGEFWRENEEALADPWTAEAPGVALALDDHWLMEELGVPSTVRFYTDLDYREESHAEGNRRCHEALGIRPFSDKVARHSPKRIEEIFLAKTEVLEGGTPWLEPTLSGPGELASLLDHLEGLVDDGFRSLLEVEAPQPFTGEVEQAWTRGPATVATSALGTTEALYLAVDEPDLMERFFRVYAEMVVRRHRLIAAASGRAVKGVGILDDNCALFSPQLYEGLCLPAWQVIARELAPDPEDTRFQHSDSSMAHLLPLLATLNLTGVNFGPTLTVRQIRQAMPHAVIHGQIAPFTLRDGSREALEGEIQRDIAQSLPEKGLVLTTAGSIPAGTSLERISLFLNLARG